mmetsp:Transcript_73913/g.165460  ORF Transcript_73913/g.165460 Transcript_73913/m.165460 type:complete len:219 (-) Transcript_73913:89-745(-)
MRSPALLPLVLTGIAPLLVFGHRVVQIDGEHDAHEEVHNRSLGRRQGAAPDLEIPEAWEGGWEFQAGGRSDLGLAQSAGMTVTGDADHDKITSVASKYGRKVPSPLLHYTIGSALKKTKRRAKMLGGEGGYVWVTELKKSGVSGVRAVLAERTLRVTPEKEWSVIHGYPDTLGWEAVICGRLSDLAVKSQYCSDPMTWSEEHQRFESKDGTEFLRRPQ